MNSVAVIPARGGSQRLPGKNLAEVGGVTLVGRTIRHALQAEQVSLVIVSTDDEAISREASSHGAHVMNRPPELAGPTVSTERVIDDVFRQLAEDDLVPDYCVLLQCTSPFRSCSDIDSALSMLTTDGFDSIVGVVEDYGLFWTLDKNESIQPVNYEPSARKREQDRPPLLRENGSLYTFRTEAYFEQRVRCCGRIGAHLMHPASGVQIDRMEDLALAQSMAHALDEEIDLSTTKSTLFLREASGE